MSAPRFPVETIPVPTRVADYTSGARDEGAMGGPGADQLAKQVAGVLVGRGQKPRADGGLAAAACLALQRAHRLHPLDAIGMDSAARRFGFGGVITSFTVFGLPTDVWREQIERVPANLTLNRFGVCVSPSGQSAAIVVGALEMEFAPVPKDLEPGQEVSIRGRVGPRFSFAHVYLTKTDGSVEEKRTAGVDVDATFQLGVPGQYRLEVMGDGRTGPEIVSNLPLYVGTAEPEIAENSGTAVQPEVAEARMFALLNEARRTAGAPPLVADPALRALAEGHTQDMHDHGFASHVSPTTGRPENRLARSGILVALFGENIAFSPTPEEAHRSLMESPGHRANMLNPKFTHVGIAAETSSAGLIVTLNFGRRPPAESLPDGARVAAALVELRSAAGLTTPAADHIYSVGAQAGADAMAAGASTDDIMNAERAAIQHEVDRARTSVPGFCTVRMELLELDQLNNDPILRSPQLRRFGIGTRLRRDEKGARLSTVMILEGVACAAR